MRQKTARQALRRLDSFCRVGIVAPSRNFCIVTDMTNEPLFPVDLTPYRVQIKDAGEKLAVARHAEKTARSRVRDVVLAALEAGVSESEAATLAGVSRLTVRAWAGK